MCCAKELTRHMATPTTADWEKMVRLGRYLKKTDPGFSCGTNLKKRRANLKRSQTQIGQVAEEHAAAQQEDTTSESVRRNNRTHIDVQRPRHAHEWSGTVSVRER